MAKRYRFYNDAGTIDAEYITDGMTNHETFFLTEIRNVNDVDIQAGVNLEVKEYTETELETLAKTLELNLEIINDTTLIADTKGGATIETFSFAEDFVDAVINEAAKTITCVVDTGTDVSDLTATFTLSDDATAVVGSTEQESGTTSNDFTSPVEYIVTSEAGKAVTWTVSVRLVSVDTDFVTFTMDEQTGAATINDVAHTVAIEVEAGTTVTALVASFTTDLNCVVDVADTVQVSGTTPNDFTSPVVYTITAEDGTTEQDWTVTVTVAS